MQTISYDLTSESWEEVLGSNNAISIQVRSANNIRLHFSDSETPPALDADYSLIESWPPKMDCECSSQTGQSKVWARAVDSPARITVVRRTL